MSQHAKKSANIHAKPASVASRMSKSNIRIAEPAKKIQEKSFEMGRDNVENIMRTADDMGHVAAECREICTGNASAILESGNAASHTFQKISNEIVKSNNRTFLEFAEILKESFACRTLDGILKLQNKAMHQMTDSYFNSTNKLCGLLFDSCNEALEPLSERTAVASKQIRKAMAA
jgi:hypothetical protein